MLAMDECVPAPVSIATLRALPRRPIVSRLKALSIVLVLAAAACTPSAGAPTWTFTPAIPAAVSTSTPGGGTPTGAPVAGDALIVTAVDLGFEPKELSVPKAGTYEVHFQNNGQIPHDITFADGTTVTALAGEMKMVPVTVPESGITFLCSIPGHADAGMRGSITVAGRPHAGGGADNHGGPPPATDVQPDPNAPAYTLYDATAPARLGGTTHDIDLVIEEQLMTVAPGFVQAVWTFGGS